MDWNKDSTENMKNLILTIHKNTSYEKMKQ